MVQKKGRKKMQNKNKTLAITIALLLTISMVSSMMLMPNATAHNTATDKSTWQIPTYAYIVAAPDPIGVEQTAHIYMWLDSVYGAAGGTVASIGTNASTVSAALLANNYRFQNYNLTITAPDGTVTQQIFAVVQDSTSSQYITYTPTQTGTYSFKFSFPGQTYGANGNGYEKSSILGDYYMPSSANTTLTVQQEPIPAATTSNPLPTAYWARPIYGENTDWWTISSNWLGLGSPPVGGWSTSGGQAQMYHQDAQGPLTGHVMWTRPLQFGGVAGGNQFQAGGSDPNSDAYGVGYFEGSSYAPRFYNPIIIQGILYYTETASFTGSPIMGGSSTGPTVAIDLRTGKQLWSNQNIPVLSFGYIYNLWDPDQHGVYPAVLVAQVTIAPGTVVPSGTTPAPGAPGSTQWNLYDANTGLSLFNVTGLPTGTTVMGPSGEQLKIALTNTGTVQTPAYYLSEWNSSKLWLYDVNPYTGGGSLSPSVINASNGALVQQIPLPVTGVSGTMPPNTYYNGNFYSYSATNSPPSNNTIAVPYGSSIIVNASIPINNDTLGLTGKYAQAITTYDWNISMPWANTMTPAPSIVAVNYNDVMLCRSGFLPTGFAATGAGTQQNPYTYFAVNLNASKGAIGNVLWTKTYTPPAGNLTVVAEPVDFHTRVFTFSYQETMQWVGYSLDTGAPLWGPTASQASFDYYGNPGQPTLLGVAAYGNIYVASFSGITYCYNDLTGKIVFTYGNGGAGNSTNAGFNVFYGDYPTQIQSISNGVIYEATNEHTVPNPIYKGCVITALNATTGEVIWKLSDYPSEWSTAGTEWATADGYLTAMNGYDQQVYSIGRGPSATTVTAPDLSAASGQPVVIHGTVTDIAAGTQQSQQATDFPNGVPVASDASMTQWMGYVYQQMPLPTNFTGVPVTISVVDANGNQRTIGTATTTSSGTYSLTWTPDIPGDYSVIATFAGTNAYWPSSMMTSFNVMSAHPTESPAPTAAPSMADLYILPGIVGIIVAIVIVGVVLALLMLRKHP